MQLLFEFSEEGQVECLGLLPGTVRSIPQKKVTSIPHGVESIRNIKPNPITKEYSSEIICLLRT